MKLLSQCILMAFLLLGAACSDPTGMKFNIDEFPDIKPFYNICGRYKGVNGGDLHWVELSFKPKSDISKIMTELDAVARKGEWDTTIFQERKRSFVKIDQATQIEDTIIVTVSKDGKSLQMILQKINKTESNQKMHNIQTDDSRTPLEL